MFSFNVLIISSHITVTFFNLYTCILVFNFSQVNLLYSTEYTCWKYSENIIVPIPILLVPSIIYLTKGVFVFIIFDNRIKSLGFEIEKAESNDISNFDWSMSFFLGKYIFIISLKFGIFGLL